MVDTDNSDQMNPAITSEHSEKDKGLSLRGLIEVFYKPGKLFENLKNHPKVLIPYIAILIVAIISAYLVIDVIVQEQINSTRLQEQLQGQPLPESAKSFMRISTFTGVVIISLLIPLLAALLAIFLEISSWPGKLVSNRFYR